MLRSLVGSEMCIRDRYQRRVRGNRGMAAYGALPCSKQPCSDHGGDVHVGAGTASTRSSTSRGQLLARVAVSAVAGVMIVVFLLGPSQGASENETPGTGLNSWDSSSSWNPASANSLFFADGGQADSETKGPARVLIVRHAFVAWDSGLTGTPQLSVAGKLRALRLRDVLTLKQAWHVSAIYTPTVSCMYGECHGCEVNKTYAVGGVHESETAHPLAVSLDQEVLDGLSCGVPLETLATVLRNPGSQGKTVLLVWNHLAVPALLSAWLGVNRSRADADHMIDVLPKRGQVAARDWQDHPNDYSSMFLLDFKHGRVDSLKYGQEDFGVTKVISKPYKYSTSIPPDAISEKQVKKEYLFVDEFVHGWLQDRPAGTVYSQCTPELSAYFFCGPDRCCHGHPQCASQSIIQHNNNDHD
eukprot:TRINITY_DN11230_c0_g1_i3.p1 TRINITY_DN11230_c0_g1~~TRINITY_DN11230_c0_g1_i3.p1  ORF type:complete len:465 (+),score=53.86 TRINITY_DN11230_c0_g1_i3:154-1395(+)